MQHTLPFTAIDQEVLRQHLQATLTQSLQRNVGSSQSHASMSIPASPHFGLGRATTVSATSQSAQQDTSFDVASTVSYLSPALQQLLFTKNLDFTSSNQRVGSMGSNVTTTFNVTPTSDTARNRYLMSVGAAAAAAAKEEQSRIEQARMAILRQQITQHRDELLLQEHCKNLIRNKLATITQPPLPATISIPKSAQLDSSLSASSSSSNVQNTSIVSNSIAPSNLSVAKTSAKEALAALGSNLRKNTDPYIDVSFVKDPDPSDGSIKRTRGGVTEPFPERLHRCLKELEKEGLTDIASFYSHGRAFGVHDIDRFVAEVIPRFFKQSKWNSFARQLSLYGFVRITSGPDAGGYYHELFLKGRPNLVFHMRRVGVPTGNDRRKNKTQTKVIDPDFYAMKKVAEPATIED